MWPLLCVLMFSLQTQRDLMAVLSADNHDMDLERMGVLTGLAVGLHNLVGSGCCCCCIGRCCCVASEMASIAHMSRLAAQPLSSRLCAWRTLCWISAACL
jgi:hypothetical protein